MTNPKFCSRKINVPHAVKISFNRPISSIFSRFEGTGLNWKLIFVKVKFREIDSHGFCVL